MWKAQNAKHLWYQRENGIQRSDPVADYINANTDHDDRVLVWGGQVGINFLSERDAPTRYIMYPSYVQSEIGDEFAVDFYDRLQENPPALIVDGSSYSPIDTIPLEERSPLKWSLGHDIYAVPYLFEVMKFIRENYVLKDIVSGIPVYMLKIQSDS